MKAFTRSLALVLCLAGTNLSAKDLALPPLPDEVAAQYSAIGRLGHAGFSKSQGCTATLIAPDLIVTAAHCASETGRSGRVFVAGWSRGDYIASRGSLIEMRHPDYAPTGKHTPGNDVALIVLKSPMTEVEPIPLGEVATANLYGTDVAVIGYHRQTPHLLSGDFTCPVIRFAAGLLHVGCPVINGNSGGPLLNRDAAGNWQVVGILSSQLGAGAIAVELPEWLRREVAAHLGQ